LTEWVPVFTSAQVRGAEKPLLDQGEPLMLRAAQALARITASELRSDGGRILVLAGSGDNGGDALFAAGHLAELDDVRVDVLLTSDRAHLKGLAAAFAAGARAVELLEAMHAPVEYDLVLDGILGIGASANPALRGTARTVVAELLPFVRAGRPRVIAVDVPSGLHPDAGTSDGVVLPASVTVTFGAVKAGLVTADGPDAAGSVMLVDIGLGSGLATVEPVGEASIAAVVAG